MLLMSVQRRSVALSGRGVADAVALLIFAQSVLFIGQKALLALLRLKSTAVMNSSMLLVVTDIFSQVFVLNRVFCAHFGHGYS